VDEIFAAKDRELFLPYDRLLSPQLPYASSSSIQKSINMNFVLYCVFFQKERKVMDK